MTEQERYEMREIRVEAVKVVGRHRKDLGDIESLARSIKELGLIHPITITEAGDLIAGQRRLEAHRLLGKETVPARIVSDLTSAVERLRTERDENTERKPMTPEELVSVGRALEALERPKAARRQHGHSAGPGKKIDKRDSNRSDPETKTVTSEGINTRDAVADALGISSMSYHRAKTVVDAAHNPTLPPEDRAVAQAALADMNATGNIAGNYQKVRGQRGAQTGAKPTKTTIANAARQRKAITAALATLSGVAHGLDQIGAIHPDITSPEAAQWVDGLSNARRAITVLISQLKERSNAAA